MKAKIKINDDHNFWFGEWETNNLFAEFKNREGALTWIRNTLHWLGTSIAVPELSEIQEDCIKLHWGNTIRSIEDLIEQLYAATYKNVDNFSLTGKLNGYKNGYDYIVGWEIER